MQENKTRIFSKDDYKAYSKLRKEVMQSSGEKTQGTWNIDGDTLTINFPPPNPRQGTLLYKILEISTSKYKIVGISGDKNVYNARRIK